MRVSNLILQSVKDLPNKEIILSLKKANSHISKIIEMVDDGAYCIDVIQQLNAVDGYIDSARRRKLQEHLRTCFAEGMTTEDQIRKEELIEELIRVLKLSR